MAQADAIGNTGPPEPSQKGGTGHAAFKKLANGSVFAGVPPRPRHGTDISELFDVVAHSTARSASAVRRAPMVRTATAHHPGTPGRLRRAWARGTAALPLRGTGPADSRAPARDGLS